MTYLLLFLEGIITFISPCLLPMLPIYLTYFANGENNRKKTFRNALGFVAGFTLVFVLLGAFAGTLGKVLFTHSTLVNLITGGIVIILGLNFTGLISIGFLNKSKKMSTKVQTTGMVQSMVFGVVFSIGWTPCVGAFLGTALIQASHSGSLGKGIILLIIYSMGLGIPFVLSALLIDRLKGTFQWIKNHYRVINMISGIILIGVGLLIMSGGLGYLLRLLSV